MFDITPSLANNPSWLALKSTIARGTPPHAVIAVLPKDKQCDFAKHYARLLLCESSSGSDLCVACRAWEAEKHPDLLVLGSEDKAPGIDECRKALSFLSIKPFCSPKRLVVIQNADGLSLPASNSLLKILEEPPRNAFFLCLSSKNRLLPTVKSRCWVVDLNEEQPLVERSEKLPSGENEWVNWFTHTQRLTNDQFKNMLLEWNTALIQRADFSTAHLLSSFSELLDKQSLPAAVTQDILFLALEEGIASEEVFSSFWQA